MPSQPTDTGSSSSLPLHNDGIFRNLPTFPFSHKGYTAIVTGANGISGFHTMRVLLSSPERWTKIYALSRRPPPKEMMALLPAEQRSRVQHVAVDFLDSPEKIAESMKSASLTSTDYIFFYSYLQPPPPKGAPAWSNAQELVDVNSALLRNFLGALDILSLTPKRFLLQTGAKNYGAHLGTIRAPAIESDPRPSHIEPNFYYPQEDMLFPWCKAHGTTWNVIRPAWILGAVNNAAMNALHPFAIYAAVCAERQTEMKFPSTWHSWQHEFQHSTAMLTGYLSEWAVLEKKCENEAFNSVDGSPSPWTRLWPEIGRWFGVPEDKIGRPDFDDSKMMVIEGRQGKDTPMGYGPQNKIILAFSMVQWASDPANSESWSRIQQKSSNKHKITQNPFDDIEANFTFGDGAFLGFASLCNNKAKRFGWTGFVDTTESLWLMYKEMEALGMLPPMVVDDPKAFV